MPYRLPELLQREGALVVVTALTGGQQVRHVVRAPEVDREDVVNLHLRSGQFATAIRAIAVRFGVHFALAPPP